MYTVDTGLQAITSTSATAILCGTAGSTVAADILALRIGIYSGASVSYPSNGTVLFQLLRPTGTASAGVGSVTPNPHNASDIAARSTWLNGATGSTISGLTAGTTVLWAQSLPFTAGANWAEWVTPGAEWRLGASSNIALYITCSSAGTATDFNCEMVFSE